MPLSEHASDANRKRFEIAVRLAELCPLALGSELALTGSTASGLADDESDLELNLWGESIPPAAARVAWLQAAGVSDIQIFEQPRPDDSYWIGGRLDDVALEVGWQTLDVSERSIETILSGSMSQVMAYILVNAIPFRSAGYLPEWQAKLSAYSDHVQAAAIHRAVQRWSQPDHVSRLARRDERLAVTEILLGDLGEMVSLLYAVNRRWQPSRKWTLAAAHDFTQAPERWRERMDDVLTAPPVQSVQLCVELILDALALVPEPYNVSAAARALQER